jgi:hypothetical protein
MRPPIAAPGRVLPDRQPVRRPRHYLRRVGAGRQERDPLPLRKRVARFRERANQRPCIIRGRGVENEHDNGAHERSLAARPPGAAVARKLRRWNQ